MNSMTGYGRAVLAHEDTTIEIELSSVNKRHLEVSFSAPKEWHKFEYDAIKELKAFLKEAESVLQSMYSSILNLKIRAFLTSL